MRLLICVCLLASLASCLPQRQQRQKVTFSNFEQRSQRVGVTKNAISNTEVLPFQVLQTYKDYRVVRFPLSKWVCTKQFEYEKDDPFKNWRKRFNGDGIAASTRNTEAERANLMFNRLFRYMVGVNSESKVIPMTRPVTDHRMPVEGSEGGLTKHELCFWTGSKYNNMDLPQPVDNNTYIVEKQSFMAFVKRINGFVLSNDDWNSARDHLMQSLKNRPDVDMESGYYSVGYDSPLKTEFRRNEVWILKTKDSPMFTDLEEETAETLAHTVLDVRGNYELRAYGKTAWACSKMEDVGTAVGSLNGWQNKFDGNPFKLLALPIWKMSPFKQMHKMVLKYLWGLNSEVKDFGENMPILVSHEDQDDGSTQMETQTVCMWLGPDYDKMDPPLPINGDVFIVNKEPHMVYARTFDGFPLSHEDYFNQYLALKKELESNEVNVNSAKWTHGIYDSFYQADYRRNEILIEKM